ncbi:DUF751 domain-containing protein [Scytonema sp. NUACC21]
MFKGFWENVFRYPRYFISILLGLFLNAFGSVVPLLKRPVTLIAVLGLFGGAIVFVTLTLRAMLGLSTI